MVAAGMDVPVGRISCVRMRTGKPAVLPVKKFCGVVAAVVSGPGAHTLHWCTKTTSNAWPMTGIVNAEHWPSETFANCDCHA